jgi:segregation and condensation protein A
MVSLPSEFRASLESYSGPLDLLLYLIKKEEIDVFDIPISRVIEQYQLFLELLKDIDPNACGEFLVMAAHLMEIKSKLLLPREVLEEEGELEDPRIELVRQLLEYKKFKERALLLERRLDEHRRRHHRPPLELPPGQENLEAPLSLGNVSVWDLLTAFHRIQLAIGQRGPLQVVHDDRPLEDYMQAAVELLESSPSRRALFEELFREVRSREEAVGFFLAILELAKEYRITLSQEDLFGPIEIRLRSEGEVERLKQEAAEAAAASGAEPAEAFLLAGEGAAALEAEAVEEEGLEAADELEELEPPADEPAP